MTYPLPPGPAERSRWDGSLSCLGALTKNETSCFFFDSQALEWEEEGGKSTIASKKFPPAGCGRLTLVHGGNCLSHFTFPGLYAGRSVGGKT